MLAFGDGGGGDGGNGGVLQIRAGSVSLLYVSPERFNNERFVNALRGVKVALFVVDEAHCISEVSAVMCY